MTVSIPEKQKQIITLLADGKFHSGTGLAHATGVSRSAIWKHLHNLAGLGLYPIAVNGKGYRLEKPIEFLNAQTITEFLSQAARSSLAEIVIHDQIDSTNRFLAEQAVASNLNSGSVCLAEHQTAGKGRRGREWVSPFGSNIYLSLLWRFPQGFANTAGLSLAIGVAAIRALRAFNLPQVGLKWPNDIYSHGKKLGGILIEVAGEADGPCHAVIGLGLNVYLPEQQAASIDQAWTDLSRLAGTKTVGRNLLVATLLNHFTGLLHQFESDGLSGVIDEWRSYDCLQGNNARLFIGGRCIEGSVQGIDSNGLLLLKQTDGTIKAFASGEVSFHNPLLL